MSDIFIVLNVKSVTYVLKELLSELAGLLVSLFRTRQNFSQ